MKLQVPDNTYTLLDSGDGEKVEQIGPYRVVRPAPAACYPRSVPAFWEQPHAVYHRSDKGGGEWEFRGPVPEQFDIEMASLKIKVRLTGFGHIGFFPEQQGNWDLIQSLRTSPGEGLQVLNLFAYSGMSTVACLRKGYAVCHVDSARGMVDWAGDNVRLNGLADAPVRWMVDDAVKFVKREVKRSRRYQGFLLDPPAFGRGLKGEVWKLESGIAELMPLLMELCENAPAFMIFSCYTHGFGPMNLERILRSYVTAPGRFFAKELGIREQSGKDYAAGSCAYFLADAVAPEKKC
jgi:23S rRNA (cytosine1962-C5)-methyltransferase